ncbi:MAG: PaaI family thioesterase [Proteobacteria bacterium]|nr:PaaI family thioesterase [Pseudomonadota bacterium]
MAEEQADSSGDRLFAGCFGCGPENDSGLGLAFKQENDGVVCRTVIDANFVGYEDFVHGGIVSTLLDEAMGWAVFEGLGRYGVTRKLAVEFRRPVKASTELIVSARIIGQEGTTVKTESAVKDSRARLLASGSAEWALVRTGRSRTNK